MGASINSGQVKSSRRRRGRRQTISEINITPFVDVMLVLLIVFMVAAPLLVLGVPINLPKAESKPLPAVEKPISISVTKDGTLYIQDVLVQQEELIDKISAITKNNESQRIFVRGDSDVDYGSVLEIVGAISSAGYKSIGLVSVPKNQQK